MFRVLQVPNRPADIVLYAVAHDERGGEFRSRYKGMGNKKLISSAFFAKHVQGLF